jgi:hypothetical protein
LVQDAAEREVYGEQTDEMVLLNTFVMSKPGADTK